MTETLTTTIKIDNWDEQPTQEHDDGTKTAHAVVTLIDGNDGGYTMAAREMKARIAARAGSKAETAVAPG